MKPELMNHTFELILILSLIVSLCACAIRLQGQPGLLDIIKSGRSQAALSGQIFPDTNDGIFPDTQDKSSGSPAIAPSQNSHSEEAEQSLLRLRDQISFPDTMFGVAYLGYVGGLFEEGFEAGFSRWLQETNAALLAQYPFLLETDTYRIAGSAGHLYCIVPVDETSSVTINRVYRDGQTQTEEISQVLYRSESGDPVLLFANLDDVPALADTKVIITDSCGNTCIWYPTLDEQNSIVPCIADDGMYLSANFTVYGYQGISPSLASWLARGYTGMTVEGLAGWEGDGMMCWQIEALLGESGPNAEFYLIFYPGAETGGIVDLYWKHGTSLSPEGVWSGIWSIETVPDGPSYVTISLFYIEGENGTADGTVYIDDTYPLLISPSGLELVLGAGENGICLPFMSPSTEFCVLTLDEG